MLGSESRSYCAIKIIRNVQKYRDAAMIEIDVLKTVQKSDPEGKFNCIKMQTWFDYRVTSAWFLRSAASAFSTSSGRTTTSRSLPTSCRITVASSYVLWHFYTR